MLVKILCYHGLLKPSISHRISSYESQSSSFVHGTFLNLPHKLSPIIGCRRTRSFSDMRLLFLEVYFAKNHFVLCYALASNIFPSVSPESHEVAPHNLTARSSRFGYQQDDHVTTLHLSLRSNTPFGSPEHQSCLETVPRKIVCQYSRS